MFVPSESLYAEIHENFDDVMQKAFRARVLLVSPSLLMLAIQVLQVIVKDARMREQTEIIRGEVGKLMDDIGRLRDRAFNLQRHFTQASDDIAQLLGEKESQLAQFGLLSVPTDSGPPATSTPARTRAIRLWKD